MAGTSSAGAAGAAVLLYQGECLLRDQLGAAMKQHGLAMQAVNSVPGARAALACDSRVQVLIIDRAYASGRLSRWLADTAANYNPSGWLVHLVDAMPAGFGLPGIICPRTSIPAIVEVTAALVRGDQAAKRGDRAS